MLSMGTIVFFILTNSDAKVLFVLLPFGYAPQKFAAVRINM